MYYILFYKTVEDYIERRAPYRGEHLELVNRAYREGSLVMAGTLSDPTDGAVIVFRGEGPEAAREFVRNDPFVKQGLITEWSIRSWNLVIGEGIAPPLQAGA